MKNLKRILSLALASVMVMGMMVVGASAAFNDQADIDHATAVNTLVALGVISGKEGNNFDPDGLLTRAEMATILSVIRNRGVAPKFGTKTTPTFSDIKGHWAESYIEYCNSFGIVGGIGGGKYDPEGKLTATQAARMILNAMGYTIEDPSNWALLTEVQARTEGVDLYAGIDEEIADPTNAQITRQQMAQMTYNALSATMAGDATYDKPTSTTPKVYKVTVVDKASLSEAQKTALEALEFETASDANAVAQSYATIASTGYKYTVVRANSATSVAGTTKAPETLGHKYLGMGTVDITVDQIAVNNRGKYVVNNNTDYTVDEDPSELMGLKVQAIVKLNASGAVTKTYGFNPVGKVVFEGTVGDIVTTGFTSTNKTIKLGGTAFKTTEDALANTSIVAWNGSSIGTLADLGAAKIEYTVKAVSNNSRGTIDAFIAMPASIEEVKYVSATSITVGNAAYSIKEEEVVGYEGLKKGDLVQVTLPANTVDGVAVLAKPETATGTITGIRNNNALIDGKWYTPASAQISGGNALELGKAFDLVMLNGYYVLAKKSSSASTVSTDLVYVTKVAGTDDFDGNKEFIGVTVDGTAVRGKTASTIAPYTAYTYEIKNSLYELTAVADATDKRAGYEKVYLTNPAGFVAAATGTSASIGGKLIADDAVIVVLHDNRANTSASAVDTEKADFDFADADQKLLATDVVKGSDAKKWDKAMGAKDSSSNTKNVVFTETVNGIEYVKLAIVVSALTDLPGAQGAGLDYGYVLTAPYRMAEGGKTYITYDIWNGSEKVTVKDTVVTGSTIAKGDYISFKTVDDAANIITATDLGGNDGTGVIKAAVAGYSKENGILNILTGGAGTTAGTLGETKVDEKTVYIYLNHGENTGMISDGVELAEEVPGVTGRYYANVVVVKADIDDGDTHKVVFVDVTNNIDDTAINGETITNAAAATDSTPSEAKTKELAEGKATLTVTATSSDGGVLTYNWIKQGETTSLGTSASIEVTAAGTYVCTITNTNNSVNGTKTNSDTTVTFAVTAP